MSYPTLINSNLRFFRNGSSLAALSLIKFLLSIDVTEDKKFSFVFQGGRRAGPPRGEGGQVERQYHEEEEEEEEEEEKNKNKKKAESPSAPTPVNGLSAAAAPAKEWTPAQYGGFVPTVSGGGGGGGGQVLIKSVNGKVVITPVPGTGNNPPLAPPPAAAPAAAAPPPPMVVATPKPPSPASPTTLTLVNGKPGGPFVNGGGPTVIHNTGNGENGQVLNTRNTVISLPMLRAVPFSASSGSGRGSRC